MPCCVHQRACREKARKSILPASFIEDFFLRRFNDYTSCGRCRFQEHPEPLVNSENMLLKTSKITALIGSEEPFPGDIKRLI